MHAVASSAAPQTVPDVDVQLQGVVCLRTPRPTPQLLRTLTTKRELRLTNRTCTNSLMGKGAAPSGERVRRRRGGPNCRAPSAYSDVARIALCTSRRTPGGGRLSHQNKFCVFLLSVAMHRIGRNWLFALRLPPLRPVHLRPPWWIELSRSQGIFRRRKLQRGTQLQYTEPESCSACMPRRAV